MKRRSFKSALSSGEGGNQENELISLLSPFSALSVCRRRFSGGDLSFFSPFLFPQGGFSFGLGWGKRRVVISPLRVDDSRSFPPLFFFFPSSFQLVSPPCLSVSLLSNPLPFFFSKIQNIKALFSQFLLSKSITVAYKVCRPLAQVHIFHEACLADATVACVLI